MEYNPDEMLCDCGHPRKLHERSAKIEAVHCTVHDQNAKAVLNATAEGKLNYEIQRCCNELIEEVKRFLDVA